MKGSIYFNYTTRSLFRGGQRTILAFLCIGVGVMAVVALQLVGLMINNSMTANIRDANGGDINVSTGLGSQSFSQGDLSYFDQLKAKGTILNYTALNSQSGSLSNTISLSGGFTVLLVNPDTYPVVTPPNFNSPSNGNISSLLSGNNENAIIDQKFADTNHKQIGDTFQVHTSDSQQQNVQVLTVKVVGIVTDTGVLAQNSSVVMISLADYQAQSAQTAPAFNTIDITTANQTQTDAAVKAINNQYQTRFVTVQTVADALQSTQSLSDGIKKFLEIAGLLALLIGGVGIVNTMQVLLSRRKIEIAMLKTTGYRRTDLYLLFGLEAGLLGLIGGLLGSLVGIGVSFVVRNVVEQAFSLDIPFVLDWTIIGGGVLIGLFTALIFGLLPIVQAATIRPLNVIRELPGTNRTGVGLTILLLFILSVLFCAMSIIILNDIGLGIGVVYGSFVFLLLLSAFFALVAFLVSKLPVPERFSIGFIVLIVIGALISASFLLLLPTFGFLLLALTAVGFFLVLMPRSWKVNTRMALRNIGRHGARTTTTLLAIFVGIFTIGLTLTLGQNVSNLLNNTIANILPFNVVAYASGTDAQALQSQLTSLPGYQSSTVVYEGALAPIMLNGESLASILQGAPLYPSRSDPLGREGTLAILSSMQGYDVANGNLPDTGSINIIAGRNLSASDVGTNDILIPKVLTSNGPLAGKIGLNSTIVVSSVDGKSHLTLTVVGIYQSARFNFSSSGIYGTKDTLAALSPNGQVQESFSLKIATTQVDQALAKISQIAPKSEALNIADIGGYVTQYLNDIILVLVVIASLSLIAGLIIIANAVALAMLERRRELGILKSVGYTSRTVLGEVLIENAVVGGLGALLAMLLVTFFTSLLGRISFNSNFSVNGLLVISLILGAALLAALTSLLVAWNSVRVRPLEVLRYE